MPFRRLTRILSPLGPDVPAFAGPINLLPMVEAVSNPWDWSIIPFDTEHADRVALMREIPFESTQMIEIQVDELQGAPSPDQPGLRGKALSLNMSPGGILLLMDWRPEQDQVLRLQVPAGVQHLQTPTLAEVRWTRDVPFPGHHNLCFVGLKFLI